jgi:hypothetical protein
VTATAHSASFAVQRWLLPGAAASKGQEPHTLASRGRIH